MEAPCCLKGSDPGHLAAQLFRELRGSLFPPWALAHRLGFCGMQILTSFCPIAPEY